ncbi:porin [Permianibacter sp. IMCC34836]|uniref:porin n=1 Tax=Permianibacter fluminis TaxID=2738515 RepID=UPI001556EC76|nr:porin [Permianibacter fluminis]NQD38468.1 porin [Permianibacter fluminis]
MTKNLLPFALTALVLASPSFAADEAAAPTVTLYGVVHLSADLLDYTDDRGTAGNLTDDEDETNLAVSSNSSRLGIRGEKALSDSLTLSYLAEWQIGATEESKSGSGANAGTGAGSNNNLSRRNQWLGLKTSYGEWRIGRFDTPLKNIRGKVDLFYSDQLGETRTITNISGIDSRWDNSVQFDLGTGAVHGLFIYSADRGTDAIDDNDNDGLSAAVTWESGAWFVGGGYEQRSYANTVRDSDSALDDTKAIRVAASFKFGDGSNQKVTGFFETVDNVSGTPDRDRDVYGVGYSFKTGDNVFKAAYYVADDLSDDTDDESGASQLSLGWDHLYGKNTVLYVTAASVSNDDESTFKVVGVGHDGEINSAAGANNSGLSAGVRYQF